MADAQFKKPQDTKIVTNRVSSRNGVNNAVLEGNFPTSWYTEPLFFEFERRAIFSKHWLLTTHRLRLPHPGSYLRFQIAGFDYFLVKNKDQQIQAFHNVCRHRAYPLLDKDAADAGQKSIFACAYHGSSEFSFAYSRGASAHSCLGWSYNMNGKLTKAPKFEELDSFDKADYGLFKIHTHVDKVGFVCEADG